jgi:hypothetical protein
MIDRLIVEVVDDGTGTAEDLAEAVRRLREDLLDAPEFAVSEVEGAPVPGTRADAGGVVGLVGVGLWAGYQIGRTEAAQRLVGILERWADRRGSRFRIRVGDGVEIEGENVSGKDIGEIARHWSTHQVQLPEDAASASSSGRKKR